MVLTQISARDAMHACPLAMLMQSVRLVPYAPKTPCLLDIPLEQLEVQNPTRRMQPSSVERY